MFLQRFYHEGLAQASYLVGGLHTGMALIVDPNRRHACFLIERPHSVRSTDDEPWPRRTTGG